MTGAEEGAKTTPTLQRFLSDVLVPKGVRRDSWCFRHTLYLGEIAFFLVLILFASGPLLMLRYTPTPDGAYDSIVALTRRVPFGALLRGLHVASSYALLAAMFLHMLRVFYTAAFKGGRLLGWYAGIALLLLFAGQSYTGYLLRWDQTGYWGTVVGTNIASYVPFLGERMRGLMLGGNDIGAPSLLRFYVAHVVLLPGAIAAVLGIHLYSLRKAGITAPASGARPEKGAYSSTEIVFKMTSIFLATLLVMLAAGVVFLPAIEEAPDPTVTPNPARAPWFVSGLQELVHYSAFWGGIVAPAAGVLLLVALPLIDRSPSRQPSDRRGVILVGTLCVAVFLVVTAIGNLFRGPAWAWRWPWGQ